MSLFEITMAPLLLGSVISATTERMQAPHLREILSWPASAIIYDKDIIIYRRTELGRNRVLTL